METEQDISSRCCPEVALWRAVIYQAMLDLHRVSSVHANSFYKHKRQAERFFFEGVSNLQMICDFADLNMSWVKEHASMCLRDPSHISTMRRMASLRSVKQAVKKKT